MKKIIAISMLGASLAATSVFGQGFLKMQLINSTVLDGFTTAGVSKTASTVNVAYFWSANLAANPMPLANTPTNGSSTTVESYTAAQAWNDILTSGWTLAQNSSTGNSSVIQLCSSRGGVNYLAGSGFGLNGSPAGGSIAIIALSWNGAFADPTTASGAGSAIGWSYLSSFTLGGSAVDLNTTSPQFTQFGTFIPLAVPEPATMALAGLGSLSLLLFRRRK